MAGVNLSYKDADYICNVIRSIMQKRTDACQISIMKAGELRDEWQKVINCMPEDKRDEEQLENSYSKCVEELKDLHDKEMSLFDKCLDLLTFGSEE